MRTKILFSLIILFMSLVSLAKMAFSQSDNALLNPGFEAGKDEWYTWNVGDNRTDMSSECTYNGNNAACVTVFGRGQGCVGQILPVNSEQTIKASAWVMNPAGQALMENAEAFLRIEFWDEQGVPLERGHVESIRLNKQGEWVKLETTATVPFGVQEARVLGFARGNNDSSKGKVYFDDFKATISK